MTDSSADPKRIQAYRDAIAADLPNTKAQLAALCALPSISAQRKALPETAAAVRRLLEAEGFKTEEYAVGVAPVIVAEAGSGPKTVLFYNHYDVQPPEPLDLWKSDPFQLTERDGSWFARGVVDDKGHLISRLASLRAVRAVNGSVPHRILFAIEGEEEIGSPSITGFVQSHAERLKADACIWEFGTLDVNERPLIYGGMKGVVCMDLLCRTVDRDMHSMYGAVVPNAATRLAQALTSMMDAEGRVIIEGFRDGIRALTPEDEKALDALDDDSVAMRQEHGITRMLGGVTGRDYMRRLIFEPVLNVNGFTSGYDGEGSKTVLPATAKAKLDIRLVPDQNPRRIVGLFEAHLKRHGFPDIEVIEIETSGYPARTDLSDPFVQRCVNMARAAYGREPAVWPIVPGSGPMHAFIDSLKVPVSSFGVGWEGSRVHSPNENIRIQDFLDGVLHGALVLEGGW